MAERWQIYSRDRTLGPWTSIQVREELRSGNIDPFDMVCKVGSSIKRPLVEVDEIFQTSRVQLAEIVAEAEQSFHEGEKVANDTVVSQFSPPEATRPEFRDAQSESEVERPRQFQALAAEGRVDIKGSSGSGERRHYRVIDSVGKVRGPHTSSEIIDLWNRGQIDARAIVKRKDQQKTISIQRFIQAFQQSKSSGIAFLSGPMTSYPRFIDARKSNTDGWLLRIVIISMIAAVGFLVFSYWKSKYPAPSPIASVAPPKQRFDLKENEDLSGRLTPPSAQKQVQTPIVGKPVEKPVVKSSPKSQGAIKKNRGQPSRPQSTYVNRWSQQRPVIIPRTNPVVVPKIVKATPTRLAPKVSLVAGKSMTLQGYSIPPGAIASCSSKCKVVVSGPQGPITAVFFKEAYGAVLAKKSQGLTLSGIIRGSPGAGWQIIINGIR